MVADILKEQRALLNDENADTIYYMAWALLKIIDNLVMQQKNNMSIGPKQLKIAASAT